MTAEEKRLRALLAEASEVIGKLPSRVELLTDDGEHDGWVDFLPLYTKMREALKRSEASKRGKSNRSRGHEEDE